MNANNTLQLTFTDALLVALSSFGSTLAYLTFAMRLIAVHKMELRQRESTHAAERLTWQKRNRRLARRLRRHQAEIQVLIDAIAKKPDDNANASEHVQHWQILRDKFSLDEIKSIALEMGIEWDNLTGSTRDEKAGELVKAARARDILLRLRAIILRERPKAYGNF